MATSNDDGDNRESSDSNVDLHGRLRNPGPNTTEIEPHDQDDEAVDELAERLRKKEESETDSGGESLEQQSDLEDIESEELEDSLLDALQSEGEDPSSRPPSPADDTNSGTGEPQSSSAAPGIGTESAASSGAAEQSPDQEQSQEQSEAQTSPPEHGRERSESGREQTLRPGDGDGGHAGQICDDCNSISPPGMRFCVECGASLEAPNRQEERAAQESPSLDRDKLDSDISEGYKLISINDDGTDGKAIPLKSAETIVGREGDTRFPTDEFLNPKHARLTIESGTLYVEDLHSLNGTYLKLRDEVRLDPGDTFLMGRQVLRFERIEQDLDSKKTAADGTRYMGSPAPGGDFKILQIGVGNLIQNIYCLPESGVVLGREKGDIIFPRDKFMSGRHARIFTDEAPHLVDLNSSNGTWIKLWEKAELKKDDYIFMGQQLFRAELPE